MRREENGKYRVTWEKGGWGVRRGGRSRILSLLVHEYIISYRVLHHIAFCLIVHYCTVLHCSTVFLFTLIFIFYYRHKWRFWRLYCEGNGQEGAPCRTMPCCWPCVCLRMCCLCACSCVCCCVCVIWYVWCDGVWNVQRILSFQKTKKRYYIWVTTHT
jgi:hypothetical protein